MYLTIHLQMLQDIQSLDLLVQEMLQVEEEVTVSQSARRTGNQVGDMIAVEPSVMCIQEEDTAASHDTIVVVEEVRYLASVCMIPNPDVSQQV